MTARTPDEHARLAELLIEQAERSLDDAKAGQSVYDRLVAAAHVHAVLSTRSDVQLSTENRGI